MERSLQLMIGVSIFDPECKGRASTDLAERVAEKASLHEASKGFLFRSLDESSSPVPRESLNISTNFLF